MLETIREFAAERLEDTGDADDVRRRHAEGMLEIVQTAHLSEDDDEPFDWPVALAEREDIRAALDWSAEADALLGLELACGLEAFWGPHAPQEGVRRIADLLARDVEIRPLLRARALRNLAGAAHQERDWDLTDLSYEDSLRIFTELDDRRGMAGVRTRLAYRAATRGETELARRLVEDSQRDARDRFPLIEGQNAILLAHMALAEGRLDVAEASLDRAAERASAVRWGWWDAIIGTLRLEIALRRGDLEEAERQGRAALAINVEDEHAAPTTTTTLGGLARVAFARDELERAGLLWGAASKHGEYKFSSQMRRWAEVLGEERRPAFVAAVARGQGLDLWEAAAIALGEEDGPQTVP